jgi:hypothetical protein
MDTLLDYASRPVTRAVFIPSNDVTIDTIPGAVIYITACPDCADGYITGGHDWPSGYIPCQNGTLCNPDKINDTC